MQEARCCELFMLLGRYTVLHRCHSTRALPILAANRTPIPSSVPRGEVCLGNCAFTGWDETKQPLIVLDPGTRLRYHTQSLLVESSLSELRSVVFLNILDPSVESRIRRRLSWLNQVSPKNGVLSILITLGLLLRHSIGSSQRDFSYFLVAPIAASNCASQPEGIAVQAQPSCFG